MGVAVAELPADGMPADGIPAGLSGGVPVGVPGVVSGAVSAGLAAARPPLIRAINEQLLLEHIRASAPCSRADLARLSGLSKPTVSLALANIERAGLVRLAGQRTGLPGRSALLYEIRPDAGFVLALDIGLKYLRGAVADLAGAVRSRASWPVLASGLGDRMTELVRLADDLCAQAGISRAAVTQTVIGCPGIYDPKRNVMALTGGLPDWDRPEALAGLRRAFGPSLAIENDVDAAALAERAQGHGQDFDDFAFVHVGTGIGMGLVLGGRLHRGAHGVAGEIAFMPVSLDPAVEYCIDPYADPPSADSPHGDHPYSDHAYADYAAGFGADPDVDPAEARRRGFLETVAGADGIVRAARHAGMPAPRSAQAVFEAATRGDALAAAVVAREARLVAAAICSLITVIDPALVVLGGGVGRAPGFASAVTEELRAMAPVLPEVRVSALGADVVVDGCLAEGTSLAWEQLTSGLQ
jgi:predicted NBD/HSP70 family sugar kinase